MSRYKIGKMNQEVYTIELTSFEDIAVLISSIENGVKNLEAQLQKEAEKKKKFFGLFYTPTKGLEKHAEVCPTMREIHQGLLKELRNFGDGAGRPADATGRCSLKVNGPTATFLYVFLKMGRRFFERHVEAGDLANKPEFVRKSRESFDRLLAQLPFNDQNFEGGFFFSDVHQSEGAANVADKSSDTKEKLVDGARNVADPKEATVVEASKDLTAFEAFYKEHKEFAQKWLDEHPEKVKALRKEFFKKAWERFLWFDYLKVAVGLLLFGTEIWITVRFWQVTGDYPYISDLVGHLTYSAGGDIAYLRSLPIWEQVAFLAIVWLAFGILNGCVLYTLDFVLWAFDQRVKIGRNGVALIRQVVRSFIFIFVIGVALVIGDGFRQSTIHTSVQTELQEQQLTQNRASHLLDEYKRRHSRHRDPTSTFVLPEIARGVPMSAEDAETAKILKGIGPESSGDSFYWINNQEEYDDTPVEDWDGRSSRKRSQESFWIGKQSHYCE
jgi:hypothetical protein